MSTVIEIEAALPQLNNEELRKVEEAVHQLYRSRNTGIIFDDAYGVWTEEDQISAAAEACAVIDLGEHRNDKS